jgi:anthranilate phosphoribosyltransferase
MMIREAIVQVAAGQSLSEIEAAAVMEEIMTGEATPSQLGAFLTALRLKGETVEEIAGMARVMREKALHVPIPSGVTPMDTCGTGGDGAGTFNISTTAALVVAACGQPVAKHGNRAATSRCGSADVLEALGVKIELKPEQVARCVAEAGFGFMFAPAYHPAMKHVGPTRREIGIRTVFNILGPLTNPAGASYQVLGVPDASLVRKMGEALLHLGCKHALIVYGEDGIDEVSLSAPTLVCEVLGSKGDLREYRVTPEDVGLTRQSRDAVVGGDAAFNAGLLRDTLAGKLTDAHADMVSLNAGAALVACERVETLAEGVQLAQETLRSGRAMQTLEEAAALSQVA